MWVFSCLALPGCCMWFLSCHVFLECSNAWFLGSCWVHACRGVSNVVGYWLVVVVVFDFCNAVCGFWSVVVFGVFYCLYVVS